MFAGVRSHRLDPAARGPLKDHCQDYPPRKEKGQAEPQGNTAASNKLLLEQIQPWTQRAETQGHTTPQQRLNRDMGPRPCQAATRSELAHTRAPSPGDREPPIHM
ncbi:hypothetical protein CRENBAI_004504 [Crenichthys baileyi]|uniref:Uncharacterized protein n=1 Tax=Crenichthys baileyi TaxID=28760 RepID=A0AAV9RGF8_9TELE